MGCLVNKVTDTLGLTDSGAAARGTKAGYAASVAGQEEGLDYLRGVDEPIRGYRDNAFSQWADLQGVGAGGAEAQQQAYSNLEEDPFYKMIMGTMDDRQETYARTQSATGDLRGGETIMGLGDVAADTREQAFGTAYQNKLSGLQGIVQGTPDYTGDIYGGITGIGNTKGKGMIAVGQAKQDADQAGMDNLLGIGKLGVKAYTAGMFSDRRLKTNIKQVNEVKGVNIYSWDWNEDAKKLGLEGSDFGVIAQEIKESHPEYVIDGDFYKIKESFFNEVLFN